MERIRSDVWRLAYLLMFAACLGGLFLLGRQAARGQHYGPEILHAIDSVNVAAREARRAALSSEKASQASAEASAAAAASIARIDALSARLEASMSRRSEANRRIWRAMQQATQAKIERVQDTADSIKTQIPAPAPSRGRK